MLDLIVIIGRFQPFHEAHLQILLEATKKAEKVLVVVGSANQPRTIENPFTWQERVDFIWYSALPFSITQKLVFEPNIDTRYDDQGWASRVQSLVTKHSKPGDKIGHIGHKKIGDNTTFYLDMFPQWDFVDHKEIAHLDARKIREIYFDPQNRLSFLQNVVPEAVYTRLRAWRDTAEYQKLVEEKRFIDTYMSQYASLKYPPIFSTVDAAVIQSGHVLLVTRKAFPGKGLMALPGGFLQHNEKVVDGIIRELREETKIKVPAPVLRGNIKNIQVFDDPKRSLCGRRITHAAHIELPTGTLPKVTGSDDATKAFWLPLSEVNSQVMFDDHYDIIKHFKG